MLIHMSWGSTIDTKLTLQIGCGDYTTEYKTVSKILENEKYLKYS